MYVYELHKHMYLYDINFTMTDYHIYEVQINDNVKVVFRYPILSDLKGLVENPTEKQKLDLKIKNQMAGSQHSKTEIQNIVLPSKKSNMAPVSVPIKVKSISKTTVLPAIQKQKTSQPTRPGTTVPVFNINSDSAARNVTVISLGIEETL